MNCCTSNPVGKPLRAPSFVHGADTPSSAVIDPQLAAHNLMAAAMAVVAQGNLRTADSSLKVSRALSAAETGHRQADQRQPQPGHDRPAAGAGFRHGAATSGRWPRWRPRADIPR